MTKTKTRKYTEDDLVGQVVRTTVAAEMITAADGKDDGYVRALVSAFEKKYRIGFFTHHTIEYGAFEASIAEQARIPLFWMHDWNAMSPGLPIGDGEAFESKKDGGLVVEGGLFLEQDPTLRRLHASMESGSIREWSIGYRILAIRRDADDEDHYFVTEAELLEASSVLRGANPHTKTLNVASSQLLGADGGYLPATRLDGYDADVTTEETNADASADAEDPSPLTQAELDARASLAMRSPTFRSTIIDLDDATNTGETS